MSAAGPGPEDVEAAVRRYLARLAVRYLPVLAGAVALVLVVLLVPSTSPTAGGGDALSLGEPQAAQDGGQPADGGTAPAPDAGGAPGTAPVADGSTGGGTGGGTTSGSGGGGTGSGGGQPVARGTGGTSAAPRAGGSAAPVAAGGVSRGGVKCSGSARQVPWTVYAPPCRPRATGDNGGATSRGVSAKEVVLSYRIGGSAQDAAIGAATGSAAPPRDTDFLADLQTYVDFFNTQYELYGRKVVLKPFQGRGDYINEDQGQGADRAQADAATARSLGAFGDITFSLRGSNPYWSALAQQKVVAWGPLGFPDSYYSQKAPYWYSYTASGSDLAGWMGNLTCRRLAGMKAIFAPDKTIQLKDRVFGLVHPENPEYVAVADQLKDVLRGCGVTVAREAKYAINVAQFQSQATSVIAQMQAAGVTTVLCYCDPVVPIFLGNAAQSQDYQPEWVQPYWGDPQARQPWGGRWGGVMTPGSEWPALKDNEAYQIFKRASHGEEPKEKYYAGAYTTLLQVYAGLQAAGPTLTPSDLLRGYRSLPTSGAGMFGTWSSSGADVWTPPSDARVAWYDPDHKSAFDGATGGYRNCDAGKYFSFSRADTWGGPRAQMHCFGR